MTGTEKWIFLAGTFLDVILLHFDDGEGGFFDTADDAPSLVRRPKTISDTAEPAGWLAAANAALTYAALTGENEYRLRAETVLAKITPLITRTPRAFGWGLVAATALIYGPIQVAVVGPEGEGTDELWRQAWKAIAPGAVIARTAPNANLYVGLLKNRPMIGNEPTAYVCRGFVCDLPTTDPTELAEQLWR